MRRSIITFNIFLILLASAAHLFAQPPVRPGNVGSEFFFSFPPNWNFDVPTNYVRLYITSAVATQVRVYGGPTLIETRRTEPHDILTIDVPLTIAQPFVRSDRDPIPDDRIYRDKAIRVVSDDPITVYAISRTANTTDGILALPTPSLGREYIIASSPDISDHNTQKLPSQYVIAAPHDNTVLTIINAWDTYGHDAGEVVTVTLMKGDLYSAMGKGKVSDLTGTIIRSNNPVSVFAGQYCTNLPITDYAPSGCSYLVETMLPVESWGKVYHLVPFATRRKGDYIRLFAGAPGATIKINGKPFITLDEKGGRRGEGWIPIREQTRRLMEFTSDKPIQVAQYNNAEHYDSVRVDPFLLVLTPLEQYQSSLAFSTPGNDYAENYINLVVDSSDWTNIEIAQGGTEQWEKLAAKTGAIPGSFPTLIDGVRYAGVSFQIAPGAYRLRGTRPFAGYIYGWGDSASYGYPLSVTVAAISENDPDAPLIESTQDCYGNVEITTTDLPEDPDRRTNLGTIELDPASFNFGFNPPPLFNPGETRTTTFKLKVDDLTSDAMAIIVISDVRGNTVRDTFYYTPFEMTLTEDPTDFGSMDIDSTPRQQTMVLNNLASRPVLIKDILLKYGNRGFRLVGPVGEFTLEALGTPGDTKPIAVEFTPTVAGSFEDSIGVRDECGSHMMALLRANVGSARILVTDIDFGQWPVDAPSPKDGSFRIRNTSTEGVALIVYGVAEGPSQTAIFTTPDGYPPFPLQIPPGAESAPIRVTFDPAAPIPYTDEILFIHNAGSEEANDSVAFLSGEGSLTTGVTQRENIPGVTLGPIAPTPTAGRATLSYQIPSASSVEITLVDATGRTVATLLEKSIVASGAHTLRFDVSTLAAGQYFCRMSVGDRLLVQPLVVR